MVEKIPVVVAYGDGIGPEIMDAALSILDAAKAPLDYHIIEVGEKIYKQGVQAGIPSTAFDLLRKHKVCLKAPITTPQGGGVKSLNVTLRKSLGLYANVRPCCSYHPYVATKHPQMDVVIVRENEEDLYSGIEHQQTPQVTQCLKLITAPGSERIIRYAFEYARRNGRKKVSCFSKDNIMKITDGLFHQTFDRIKNEYPEIETDHWIIDIGTAKLAESPEIFDVIVTMNLYGDIISDVAAQITGSVGLAGSANIGEQCAMFEAIHGSAPTIAGQNIANPSGLILSSVMMLAHVGLSEEATLIHNAWSKTVEDGLHTSDIYKVGTSKQKLSTKEFAKAVISHLGEKPSLLKSHLYKSGECGMIQIKPSNHQYLQNPKRELVGVDVFVYWTKSSVELAEKLLKAQLPHIPLKSITNRGLSMWPESRPEAIVSDQWPCRFLSDSTISHQDIIDLLSRLHGEAIDFIKMEQLYTFDGRPGFSKAQGE